MRHQCTAPHRQPASRASGHQRRNTPLRSECPIPYPSESRGPRPHHGWRPKSGGSNETVGFASAPPSGTERKANRDSLAQWSRYVGELDQPAEVVLRVNDVLHYKRLRTAERRRQVAHTGLNTLTGCILVAGRFDLRLVRYLQPSFDRQRTPLRGRPCIPEIEAVGILVASTRYAKSLAKNHCAPWHRALSDGRERPHSCTHHALLLSL